MSSMCCRASPRKSHFWARRTPCCSGPLLSGVKWECKGMSLDLSFSARRAAASRSCWTCSGIVRLGARAGEDAFLPALMLAL
eukprot:12972012-Heterocapsa_arctica.AAC.1